VIPSLRAVTVGLAVLVGAGGTATAIGPAEADPVVPTLIEAQASSSPRRHPIADSVEKAVEEVMRRHYDPCAAAARKGVPCFPSGIDVLGPRFSVAEAMRKYRPDGRRAEAAPITASDMHQQMGGAPLSASGGVSVDPVCTVKSLVRRMSGTGRFYLYRLTDGRQERPVLTDRKIEAAVYPTNPRAVYEYLGEYAGECEAIAAWRKALREEVGTGTGAGRDGSPAPTPTGGTTDPPPP
jgi:hypothetical protein